MIPVALHSKDHVWKSQKIRGGIQILFPKGFSLCKMQLLQHPPPSTLSSPLKPDKSAPKSSQTLDSQSPALLPWRPPQYQVSLLLIWLQALWTAHFIMPSPPPNQIKALLPWNNWGPQPAVVFQRAELFGCSEMILHLYWTIIFIQSLWAGKRIFPCLWNYTRLNPFSAEYWHFIFSPARSVLLLHMSQQHCYS